MKLNNYNTFRSHSLPTMKMLINKYLHRSPYLITTFSFHLSSMPGTPLIGEVQSTAVTNEKVRLARRYSINWNNFNLPFHRHSYCNNSLW